MSNYARLDAANVVIEVCNADALATHESRLRAQFVACPDTVHAGDSRNSSGAWIAAPTPPAPPAPPAPTVSPLTFKMLFTSAERIAIKSLRQPGGTFDAIIDDFMSIVDDPRLTGVVMALPSVQAGIEYTLSKIHGGSVDARLAEILSGVLR